VAAEEAVVAEAAEEEAVVEEVLNLPRLHQEVTSLKLLFDRQSKRSCGVLLLEV
jgi:hypothetical protein